MTLAETSLLASAGILYAASIVLVWRSRLQPATRFAAAGLGLHLACAAERWVGSGHPPIFGTYEAALAGSWFVALLAVLPTRAAHRQRRTLLLTALPVALLLLAYGVALFDTRRIPLTISERSLWVDFHALFAWLAFAPFTLACGLSAYVLRAGQGGEADLVDELAFRYVTVGFVSHSLMFALGSYYSAILFGTWWRWDPAFSLSLLAWLLVGLHIHLRLFYHWSGRRSARLYLGVFALVAFSYWGLVYLPAGRTFHVFDLNLKAL